MTYTITLADGTRLENLGLNGTNYISSTELDESIFTDNTNPITITDSDGNEKVISNAVFIQQMQFPDGFYICFRQKTKMEMLEDAMNAKLDYLAMMTDVEL